MSMGHKEILKGGDEYDFLTKARKFHAHRSGEVSKVKRKFWKRQRTEARSKLHDLWYNLQEGIQND
jgi:hypothetical protein